MNRDLSILARTLYGEARGSSDEDRIAIAWVARNRLADPKWWSREPDVVPDDTFAAVCLDPKQFSCWNSNDANFRATVTGDETIPAYLECLHAALTVMLGKVPDPTGGATHYATINTVQGWMTDDFVTIGKHKFYRNVN
jgi:spore germination cell wall hydrolase CwlJ-like protein